MKFTITPLGGASRNIDKVVGGIVAYLQPQPAAPQPQGPGGPDGPSQYYADSSEEPGRWLGAAADHSGLVGAVERQDFARVLAGRDPHTGERLITAQGSAGRRAKLGVGNHTTDGPNGERWYDESDAAAALGVTKTELSRMLDVGTGIAVGHLGSYPTSVPGPHPGSVPGSVPTSTFAQPRGSFLVPVVGADETRCVDEQELLRCVAARDDGTDPETVRATGPADDLLPIGEAARLAGVTSRYLRKVAKYHDDHRDEIDRTLSAGRRPRKAYLVAQRGTRSRWFVTRTELAEFLERRRPPAVRVGFDLTLTTEKSLGVLALLGGPEAGSAVLGAIESGNDWAMAWLESRAAAGRVNGKPVPALGWTAASFRHLTSRALDPFPHHHNVIANSVTLPDGSRRALDARGLYRHGHAASALATAEMRHQLTTRLGVRWRPGRKRSWEIDGISDEVVAEFSRRRSEIDDALAELEDAISRGSDPVDVGKIALRTRPAKDRTPVDELVDGWRRRAAGHGLTGDALERCRGRILSIHEPDPAVLFAAVAAADGICEGGSIFTRADALVALANQAVPGPDGPQPLLCGAARLEELTAEFLMSSHVVALDGREEPTYTTTEMLGVQERIVRRFASGLHDGSSLTPQVALDEALDNHAHLTDEQRDLVSSWCTTGHIFQAAIGRAGAGKTTSVAAASQAWETSGYRVVGAAVKGEAARTLAAATGIDCETVAWYLAHDDPQANPLDARTVLVVDEASTLADRDLDALMAMTVSAGATLRLIGDPAQHGAVAAGGMFRVLCERYPVATPELTTTHRLQDPNDRAAAEALRGGRIDDALAHLQDAGHLHVVDDELDMYRDVLARWWDAHRAGHDHPMVDRRNITRHQLNRLAHRLRQVNGEVGTDEIRASGERCFSVGDRITARVPDRDLHPVGDRQAYVRNGALGTITAIERGPHRRDDTITAEFDGIGTIELPRSFFDHHTDRRGRSEVGIDHAYALTSYAVQGSTSDMSTSRVDATATRAETYVDITRGQLENHLYLTATTDPLDGEALPRVPLPPIDEAVAERLDSSTAELTAWELAQRQQMASAATPGLGL